MVNGLENRGGAGLTVGLAAASLSALAVHAPDALAATQAETPPAPAALVEAYAASDIGANAGIFTVAAQVRYNGVSPRIGKGMSPAARLRLQQVVAGAGAKYGVDPNLVASIDYIENPRTEDATNDNAAISPPAVTGNGNWSDLPPPLGKGPAFVNAPNLGLMQISPGTFKIFGVDANGDGKKDPNDIKDNIYTAANYLGKLGAANTTSTAKIALAVLRYNHSSTYVRSALNTLHYLEK